MIKLAVDRLPEQPRQVPRDIRVIAGFARLARTGNPSSACCSGAARPQSSIGVMAGGQQPDVLDQRAVGEEVLEGEIFQQRRPVDVRWLMRDARRIAFCSGAEREHRSVPAVVKRLDAVAVARQQQPRSRRSHSASANMPLNRERVGRPKPPAR